MSNLSFPCRKFPLTPTVFVDTNVAGVDVYSIKDIDIVPNGWLKLLLLISLALLFLNTTTTRTTNNIVLASPRSLKA
jgi:hypothetical protein